MESTRQQQLMISAEGAKADANKAGERLDVLKLVLQQLSLDSGVDKAVACKLLCCSTVTTAMVHHSCAGKLTMEYIQLFRPTPVTREQLCTWLAKQARLLRALNLDCFNDSGLEDYVAAGLRAAAGVPSMRPAAGVAASSCQRSLEAAQHIVQSEETAQQALVAVPLAAVQPQQSAGISMLPLQAVQLAGAQPGTLVPTIAACCRQLTQLHVREVGYESAAPPVPELMLLRDLQDLKLSCRRVWTEGTLPSISSLTHLTKFVCDSFGTALFGNLPVSLVDLTLSDALELQRSPGNEDLQRLTNLTRLQVGGVQGPQSIPAQLQELHVQKFTWDEGFMQLSQLRSLHLAINWLHDDDPDFSFLTALTQLTAVKLSTRAHRAKQGGMAAICAQLPKLPLVHLESLDDDFTQQDMEQLGLCTQLTKLSFEDPRVGFSVGAFSQLLRKLTALERLSMNGVRFMPHPYGPLPLEPLIDTICQLHSGKLHYVRLWRLMLSSWQLSVMEALFGPSFKYCQEQMPVDSMGHESSAWDPFYDVTGSDSWDESDGGSGLSTDVWDDDDDDDDS